MFDYKSFVSQIVELRKRAGYSQRELANKINTSQAAINSIENFSRIPRLDTIAKYSDVLDFDVVLVPGFASGEYIKTDDLIQFINDTISVPERDKLLQFIEENKHKF